jgi:hypothetical protein
VPKLWKFRKLTNYCAKLFINLTSNSYANQINLSMESNFMIYFLLLVKLFQSAHQSVYNKSSLKNSIVVIKKNPYGDIIIKSETVNMNSTTLFDDQVYNSNVSDVNISSADNATIYYSSESNRDSSVSSELVTSLYNVTSNATLPEQNCTTRRRSILRRLFDKLL